MLDRLPLDVLNYFCQFVPLPQLFMLRLMSHQLCRGVRKSIEGRAVLVVKEIRDLWRIKAQLAGRLEVKTLRWNVLISPVSNGEMSMCCLPWVTFMLNYYVTENRFGWPFTSTPTYLHLTEISVAVHIPSHIKHLRLRDPNIKYILSFPEQLEILECDAAFIVYHHSVLERMLPPSTTKLVAYSNGWLRRLTLKRIRNAELEVVRV